MFVFYDTETTGTDTAFSQVLQCGYLVTDDDFNIIASKKIDCRNSPWVLPSPGAMLTTGFTPDDMKTRKTTNYEMIQGLDAWLHSLHGPLTFFGYNSMKYDEPVMAQNSYQNLLDPHFTTHRNGRGDVMSLVEAVLLYVPGALKLEELNYFKMPSLKLKAVAQQNGVKLSDEDAHDALNDTRATVGVAKVIKTVAPQVWAQILSLTTSKGVEDFLAGHEIFTYANTSHYDEVAHKPYPIEANVMTSLSDVPGTQGQALFDLHFDPAPYLDASVDELKAMFLAKDHQKPFVLISKDKQPVLMPMDLSASVLHEDDKVPQMEARAKALKANKAFMKKVAEAAALAQKEAQVPADVNRYSELGVDTDLPAPVRAKLDSWMKDFNGAESWSVRANLVSSFRETFKAELEKDPSLDRFVRLAGRLVYEHAPQELNAAAQEGMKKFIAARLLNPDLNVPYMTIAKARKELSTIEWHRREKHDKWREATDSQIRCLKLYYTALEKEYAPYSPYTQKAANTNEVPPQTSVKKAFKGDGPKA